MAIKPVCKYLVLKGCNDDVLDFCFKCKMYPDFDGKTSYRMIVNCLSCKDFTVERGKNGNEERS